MRRATALKDEDALPGAKKHAAICDRDSFARTREQAADVAMSDYH